MDLQTQPEGNILILSIAGKLDAVTTPQFEQKIRELIDGGTQRILVDLDQLDYISSAGLRGLLLLSKLLKAKGGQAGVANIKGNVRSVFEMSAFATILPVSESRAAGLARLQ
ncbi:MAG: hypothetical protein RJA22_2934 [Verrucomicrobiota bacterium]|jgi:stage II sporulation protein AA (anti-sigma F factor antagonist)